MTLLFGPFVLDVDGRQLTREGRPLHLTTKAFDLLVTLVAERPKVLSKTALQQRLWPKTFVAEANLSNLVGEIRRALGENGQTPTYMRTSHGVGYAFCAEAAEASNAPRTAMAEAVACWIEWGAKRFPLSTGEHVIGRDPDTAVRIDAGTVSRHHARLRVDLESAVLEDCDSKNGSFHGEQRVRAPVVLADGDVIRLGEVVLTFHVRGLGSTETQMQPPV